jgi:hypothetical protein
MNITSDIIVGATTFFITSVFELGFVYGKIKTELTNLKELVRINNYNILDIQKDFKRHIETHLHN